MAIDVIIRINMLANDSYCSIAYPNKFIGENTQKHRCESNSWCNDNSPIWRIDLKSPHLAISMVTGNRQMIGCI